MKSSGSTRVLKDPWSRGRCAFGSGRSGRRRARARLVSRCPNAPRRHGRARSRPSARPFVAGLRGRTSSWAGRVRRAAQGPRRPWREAGEWRAKTPVRAVAFAPPVDEQDRDAPDVVQVHLEHRLVRRLLSRFVSQGFQPACSASPCWPAPAREPRVVLMGRLCLYGSGAQRLHERILRSPPGGWTAARSAQRERKLSPSARRRGPALWNQLEDALRHGLRPAPETVKSVPRSLRADIADLLPELRARVASASGKRPKSFCPTMAGAKPQELRRLLRAQREAHREGRRRPTRQTSSRRCGAAPAPGRPRALADAARRASK